MPFNFTAMFFNLLFPKKDWTATLSLNGIWEFAVSKLERAPATFKDHTCPGSIDLASPAPAYHPISIKYIGIGRSV